MGDGPEQPPRRHRAEPVLPDITRDERDEGWSERRDADDRDAEWYERERPPHHE